MKKIREGMWQSECGRVNVALIDRGGGLMQDFLSNSASKLIEFIKFAIIYLYARYRYLIIRR